MSHLRIQPALAILILSALACAPDPTPEPTEPDGVDFQVERRDGRIIGVRVVTLDADHLLHRLGVEPGEVITSVNGIRVSGPEASARILSEFEEADVFAFVILEEDGTERRISYDMSHPPPSSGAGL